MAEVVLIRPAYTAPGIRASESRPPAGLLYVAAPLVGQGCDVVIIDQMVERDWRERLQNAVDRRTLCVGITSLTSYMIINGLEIARLVREREPRCPVVWGGIHPTVQTDSTIASELVDIVVVGEGEETFAELVDALRRGSDLHEVRGIVFKDARGTVIKTEPREPYDLNLLPPLPMHLANLDLYRGSPWLQNFFQFGSPLAVSIETSRGCTHRCTYCVLASRNLSAKACWKGMRADRILETITPIMDTFGVRAFAFIDDNFFVDLDRVKEFLDQLERRNLRIEWFADVRMDTIVDQMDLAFLQRLERNGCRSLSIGIESGSDRILKYLRKGATREVYLRANRMLAHTGITAQYGLIQGLPTETPAEAKQTYTLIATLVLENPRAAPSINKLLPTPGTPLLEECKRFGLIEPGRLEDWADYCDTSWRGGPAVWMDPEAAKFMTRPSQVLYRQLLLRARSQGRSPFYNLLLLVLSRVLLFRIEHDFFAFPVAGWVFQAFRWTKDLVSSFRRASSSV
jgi:anaerobic magnesium-protoporphyrin IX monomethyl ester cyclase